MPEDPVAQLLADPRFKGQLRFLDGRISRAQVARSAVIARLDRAIQ
jgi:hypothetical protein